MINAWRLKVLREGQLLLEVKKYEAINDPMLLIPLVLCPLTDSPKIQRLVRRLRHYKKTL